MARYYLIAKFTAGFEMHGNKFGYIYSRAPDGFLFHDTEEDLPVSAIQLPLKKLSELFEDSTKALILRIDAHTLIATFSLNGFPYPVKHGYTTSDEWLQKTQLEGYLISDVNDPKAIHPCNPDDVYSNCIELPRYTGGCPCPLQRTGECREKNLYSNLPAPFAPADMHTDFLIEKESLKRVKYKNLVDFEFISGAVTTEKDFQDAIRPWNTHDFDHVEERKTELSSRGKERHRRDKFRKEKCKACCFASVGSNYVRDCGLLNSCETAVSDDTAWSVIWRWYKDSNFESMPGFTSDQRDFLIHRAGDNYSCRAINKTRRTKIKLAGFVKDSSDNWCYQLSAAAGLLQRFSLVASWGELVEIIPQLSQEFKPITLNSKTRLACAILGSQRWIYQRYRGHYPVYRVQVYGSHVEATGAATRYEATSKTLDTGVNPEVKRYYALALGYDFPNANIMPKTTA